MLSPSGLLSKINLFALTRIKIQQTLQYRSSLNNHRIVIQIDCVAEKALSFERIRKYEFCKDKNFLVLEKNVVYQRIMK